MGIAKVVDGKIYITNDGWVTINGKHVLLPDINKATPNMVGGKFGKVKSQKKKLDELYRRAKKHDDEWTEALENESERRGGSMDIYRSYVMAKTEEEKDRLWKEFEKAQKEENKRLKPAKERNRQAMYRYKKLKEGLDKEQKKYDAAKGVLEKALPKIQQMREYAKQSKQSDKKSLRTQLGKKWYAEREALQKESQKRYDKVLKEFGEGAEFKKARKEERQKLYNLDRRYERKMKKLEE